MKIPLILLALIACLPNTVAAGLDGATGHIFKLDAAQRCFELLKETEYDPKADLTRSRFTVYWDENTVITRAEERKDFTGLKGPFVATFQGIDEAGASSLAQGKQFTARVANLYPPKTPQAGMTPDRNLAVGRFTPADGDVRGGLIELDGRSVAVMLRERHSRVYLHQMLAPEELANGFWKTTLHGSMMDGRFVVGRMEVSPLVDPRATDDPKLPRVLVIGDSISMNYHDQAKAALRGVANYHRNEGNAFSSAFGVTNSELWLGDWRQPGLRWDVIQFNHGLHDLKQAYDAQNDRFGEYAVPLEQYKENLEKIIAILGKTGARLIWCSTTPVPNHNMGPYARRKGAERDFNQAAMEVMRRHPEVVVNDLCRVIDSSPVFDAWREGIDVHFYKEEERRVLGEAVAAAVRQAMAAKKAGGGS